MSLIEINPTPTLAEARRAYAAFLPPASLQSQLVALHDSDADGVSAGVLWQRALERLGCQSPVRLVVDRDRNPWNSAHRGRLAATAPEQLFVLDLGCRPEPLLPGIPTCFIDHHRPDGVPPDGTLISAYGWEPTPTTSLLLWDLCSPLVDLSDLDWIAVIGVIGDLGEHAPFTLLAEARRKYTAKYLREATALVNAARRSATCDPEAAASALLSHADPRSLAASTSPDVDRLRLARAEVKAALEEAKKTAPLFAGKVALLRIKSPCQIHPLLAQIWRTRLPQHIVVAANEGYLPERVNFSVRSQSGANLIDFLRDLQLPAGEGTLGQGHDQATGGSLPYSRWNELLARMGFPSTAFAHGNATE